MSLHTLQAKADAERGPRMMELSDGMVAVAHPGGKEPRIITREQWVDELAQQVIDRLETQAAHDAIRRLFDRSRR